MRFNSKIEDIENIMRNRLAAAFDFVNKSDENEALKSTATSEIQAQFGRANLQLRCAAKTNDVQRAEEVCQQYLRDTDFVGAQAGDVHEFSGRH